MTFELDAPEDLGGGDYMTLPGEFHFLVTDIRNGKMSNGDMLSGFSVELQAQSGEEIGKKINLNLRNGELTHKDGGEMCRKKQAAFLIAANCMAPDDLGKKVKIELESAMGQQICAELEKGEPNDRGKSYLDVRFANMYHVDDPRAKSIAKDEKVLSVIPDDKRRKPEFFEKLTKGGKPKPKVDKSDFEDL